MTDSTHASNACCFESSVKVPRPGLHTTRALPHAVRRTEQVIDTLDAVLDSNLAVQPAPQIAQGEGTAAYCGLDCRHYTGQSFCVDMRAVRGQHPV
jgi:hypothetical protein